MEVVAGVAAVEEEDEVEASGEVAAVVEGSAEEAAEVEVEDLVEAEVEGLEVEEEASEEDAVRTSHRPYIFSFFPDQNFNLKDGAKGRKEETVQKLVRNEG